MTARAARGGRTVGEAVAAHIRDEAHAALAVLDQRPLGPVERATVERLVRAAVREYRRRYPACPATGPWLFHDGDPTTTQIKTPRGKPPERVDVYCLYCRTLLVNGAVWQRDYGRELEPHTTRCALLVLAGRLEPGAPGTYRLPEAVP